MHRLVTKERPLSEPTFLSDLSPGDVFVREGTAHMVIFGAAGPLKTAERLDAAMSGPEPIGVATVPKCWVVNLTNGAASHRPATDLIWPAQQVELTYRCARKD